MGKIIDFPTKLTPKSRAIVVEKSDIHQLVDMLIRATKSSARSQGFMIGILIANFQHFLIQYFIK